MIKKENKIHSRNLASAVIAVLIVAGLVLSGCGKDKGKDEGSERFRIPDSLLAPIESYQLLVDDYHPISGGVMANKDIELHYPASDIARFIAVQTFGLALESFRTVTKEIARPTDGKIYIVGTKDLDEYMFVARKEWWYYGVIQGDTIYFEPFDIMMKRVDRDSDKNIAQIGMVQKMAQMALRRLSGGNIPIWMREAVASYFAGESHILRAQAEQFRKQVIIFNPSQDELENYLLAAEDMVITRESFYYAYRMLENLLEFASIDDILSFVRMIGSGKTLDEASIEAFGVDYDGLIERIDLKDGLFAGDEKGSG